MKMKNTLSTCAGALLVGACFLMAAPVEAQEGKINIYAGYAYLKADDVTHHGFRLSPEYHLNTFASIVADVSYEKGTVSSGNSTITTYLGGIRLNRGVGGISVYVHALAGGVKNEASVKPVSGVTISVADTGLGLDGGGGVDFKIGARLKLRLGADYLRRKIDTGGGTTINENDIRATAGIVF